MTWTTTKTTVTVGVAVLLLAALALVVKLKYFPSVDEKYFRASNSAVLKQAPPGLAIVRPTHFPKPPTNAMNEVRVNGTLWMAGRNMTFKNLMALAYNDSPGRVALPPDAPKGNYDFLVTTKDNPQENLQLAIRRKLHYTAQRETRDTPVLALKVEDPNSPGLQLSAAASGNQEVKNGRLYFTHQQLTTITSGLERLLNTPIVDETGLTNFYDFSLVWDAQTAQQIQSGTLDHETGRKILAEWGLGLEPDTASIEMLVVKRGG